MKRIGIGHILLGLALVAVVVLGALSALFTASADAEPVYAGWSDNTRLYRTGNSYTLTTSLGSLNYQDAGQWYAIDEAATEADSGAFTLKWTKLPYVVRVGNDSYRCIYPRRAVADAYLCIGKPFASMGAPVREGNKFTWDFTHATLSLEVQGGAVKFDAILKDALAPTSLTFPFEAQGLTRTGSIVYYQGQPVAELRKPIACDSSEPKICRDLTVTWGAGNVTISLDTTGMAPPIAVDPSIDVRVGASSDDAYDSNAFIGYSHTDTNVYVGVVSSNAVYSGFRWAAVNIPSGATIDSAQVTLTEAAWDGDGHTVTVRFEDSGATQSTFSSGNSPMDRTVTTASASCTLTEGGPDSTHTCSSLASIVQEVVDSYSGATDLTAIFDGTGAAAYKLYYAYDGSTTKAARLEITYTEGGSPTPTPTFTPTPTSTPRGWNYFFSIPLQAVTR